MKAVKNHPKKPNQTPTIPCCIRWKTKVQQIPQLLGACERCKHSGLRL